MDTILMGYWVVFQVRNMMISIMYNGNFMMRNMILSWVRLIPCEMFLRSHLRNTNSIYLLGSGRSIVGGLVDLFLKIVVVLVPLSWF